ncbi:hypothetical protein SNOG_05800 [Parastagonospora nodorum SN15]|uniref:Uncharacterized protein n=1 Tax=Phaeosphaeria nodorum (strain SN15 / ATCC MYA-4574 / FGSC 10173) TaxID=321614 RepID=Q0UR14_PHANO|nr:hypothetical protein SNOG_05800 [Parastagonospora nodorum SN15]EAT86864.1 hypothetical protein SNOG_05800 [Parastagonospora nodorum SN15]
MAADSDKSEARALPTADELAQALKVEVYDNKGKSTPLGDLAKGQRTALIFIRHFFFVRRLSEAVPPSDLPANTRVLVIGCGSYQPIDDWATAASSKYPVYTDPSNKLYTLFKFKSNLSQGDGSEPRDYMRDAGGAVARWFSGITAALGSLQNLPYVGPKSQNGGEVILSAEGECEFISRMQTTVDHTNVSELATLLGASKHDTAGQ